MSDDDRDRDRDKTVTERPGRAHRVGTDHEPPNDVDRTPRRGRTRSEWEADGGRSPPRYSSPFERADDDEDDD